MITQVSCPVSTERIAENVVKKTALQVFLLSIIWIWQPNVVIPIFLMFDFAIRSFTSLNISIIGNIAKWINKRFPAVQNKLTDRAPKRFAAGVGFVLTTFIVIVSFLGYQKSALSAFLILTICAALEGFLGICIGCHVYSLLKIELLRTKVGKYFNFKFL